MTELLELALALFVVSQLIGLFLGLVMAAITIVYVTAKTLLDIYRR